MNKINACSLKLKYRVVVKFHEITLFLSQFSPVEYFYTPNTLPVLGPHPHLSKLHTPTENSMTNTLQCHCVCSVLIILCVDCSLLNIFRATANRVILPSYGCCSSLKYYKFTTTRDHLNKSQMAAGWAPGAPSQTPLGDLTAPPDPLAGGELDWLPPSPRTPFTLGPLGLDVRPLRASVFHTPQYFLTPSSFIF